MQMATKYKSRTSRRWNLIFSLASLPPPNRSTLQKKKSRPPFILLFVPWGRIKLFNLSDRSATIDLNFCFTPLHRSPFIFFQVHFYRRFCIVVCRGCDKFVFNCHPLPLPPTESLTTENYFRRHLFFCPLFLNTSSFYPSAICELVYFGQTQYSNSCIWCVEKCGQNK